MKTVAALLADARQQIPIAEARLLLGHLLGKSTAWLEAQAEGVKGNRGVWVGAALQLPDGSRMSARARSWARLDAEVASGNFEDKFLSLVAEGEDPSYLAWNVFGISWRVMRQWIEGSNELMREFESAKKAGADKLLPNQATIDAMAAKFGGRTIDGLAKIYGDGSVNIVKLK